MSKSRDVYEKGNMRYKATAKMAASEHNQTSRLLIQPDSKNLSICLPTGNTMGTLRQQLV